MASTFTIDTREIERYTRHLEGMRKNVLHVAHRMMMNNMAFGVRAEVLERIPKIMVVRNKRFLATTILVDKARSHKDNALLYQAKRTRYGGLREQEFGGVMGRQVATLAARGKNKTKRMQTKSRLMPGKILSPDDITVTGEKSDQHRAYVFLLMLQRKTAMIGHHKGAFIFPKTRGFKKGGLMKLGKLATRRQESRVRKKTKARKIITLQRFEKGQKRVKRMRWMRPSIDNYLRRADPAMEWRKIMRLLISRNKLR